jgi:hypothetical protein
MTEKEHFLESLETWERQFVLEGFTCIPQVFSAAGVKECQMQLSLECARQLGVDLNDHTTWPRKLGQKNTLRHFFFPDSYPWNQVRNEEFERRIDRILGPGRWQPLYGIGWFVISYPNIDSKPWRWRDYGWHVDGSHFNPHRLHSPEQALTPIMLFSDIEENQGGTAFIPGSHVEMIRYLHSKGPRGAHVDELGKFANDRYADVSREQVFEATGKAGTVWLLHPLLVHSGSKNLTSIPRIIANPPFVMKESFDFLNDAALIQKAATFALFEHFY